MGKLSFSEKTERLRKKLYPEAVIKEHNKTIDFSFPYTVSLSFTSLFMNNNTIDLFTDSPMVVIMRMGYYKVPPLQDRQVSYTNWLTEAFCNIYKFNVQRVLAVDIEENHINCDTITSHKVNRMVKGNKPQCLYIEKDEDGNDVNVILRVNLETSGFLYVSQSPQLKERNGKMFNEKKVLAIAGTISGSIKKRDIFTVVEENVLGGLI